MPRSLNEQIADSLDATAALLPILSRLFTGITSLGGTPTVAIRMLRDVGMGPRHRIIDLGCGKGTVAIAAARQLGCRVLAVDACAPFLEDGARRARRHRVADRIEWMAADVRRLPAKRVAARFDAALMLGVLPFRAAIAALRPLVRPDGVCVVDDCITKREATPPRRGPTFACGGVMTLDQCNNLVELQGDRVESTVIAPAWQTRRVNDRLYARLSGNAARLRRTHPHLRTALTEFLGEQRRANALINDFCPPCTWLIRRR
jgi:SAM-dependent methyltransferase